MDMILFTHPGAYLGNTLQFTLGIVFTISSFSKVSHPRAFVRTVVAYQILSRSGSVVVALGLMIIEPFLAITFLTGWLANVALPLAAGCLLIFLIVVLINLGRGNQVACGCFGGTGEQISVRTATRLGLLIAVAALLAVLRATGSSPLILVSLTPPGVIAVNNVVQIAIGSVFSLITALWALSLPELTSLARHIGHRQTLSPAEVERNAEAN